MGIDLVSRKYKNRELPIPPVTKKKKVKMIHDYIIRNGFESHVTVGNSLVVLYAKCEIMEIMHLIFHRKYKISILSLKEMIIGYA
jgi:hypothetical protein